MRIWRAGEWSVSDGGIAERSGLNVSCIVEIGYCLFEVSAMPFVFYIRTYSLSMRS